MFVNYKIEASEAATKTAAMRATHAASGRAGTFEENAVRVLAQRLLAHPERYLEFGPYWWAVKAVLLDAGALSGDRGDPLVAAAYSGPDAATTLVMAEAFKDVYRASFIVGTRLFDLGGEGIDYELVDEDMDERVAAGA